MKRREWLTTTAGLLSAPVAGAVALTEPTADTGRRLSVGFDAHAMRAMKWKSPALLTFAIEQSCEALLINNPSLFDSLEAAALQSLRQRADDAGVRVYVGAGGVCQNGTSFRDTLGTAEQTLTKMIGVATTLGSPVVNVRIGSVKDRFLKGGIRPRIDEAIRVLKAVRPQAEDAGIRFGFENHAGDLRTEEVLEIIDAVGADVCGAMLDPGNAVWTMEDPMQQVRTLAPHVVCMSVRDYMVWPSAEGATFQWTAIGDGLMDVDAYMGHLQSVCPDVPVFVETISNSQRPIPFLTDDWWTAFPTLKAAEITDFLQLLRRGAALNVERPPAGMTKKAFDQQHQRREFEKSVARLRQTQQK